MVVKTVPAPGKLYDTCVIYSFYCFRSYRYIFTMLSPLTRVVFNSLDDGQLNYLYDDNQRIEPEWYCPIIPMVLVNGAEGIGTGYSTFVPNYNPREIVSNLKRLINGLEPTEMVRLYVCTTVHMFNCVYFELVIFSLYI